MADSSNAPGFTHFRHTMLKYVDVYRCSDGGALVGHRHNRPGPDNSARAPYMQPFATVAGARHDQLCMEERARPHAGVPCFRRSLGSSIHGHAYSALATSGLLANRSPVQTSPQRPHPQGFRRNRRDLSRLKTVLDVRSVRVSTHSRSAECMQK